jgi:peptidoglycan/LPS O-acetylase OafA/YrhL
LIFFPIRKRKNLLKIALSIIIFTFFIGNIFYHIELKKITAPINLELAFDLGTYFLMGSLIACFEWEKIPYKIGIVMVATILLVIATLFKIDYSLVQISLPFLIIYLGKQTSKIATISHTILGDPSYGIYLYGFPIQQFIIYFYKPSTPLLLVSSTIASFVIGYLSWILIEKRALQYKNIFSPKRNV